MAIDASVYANLGQQPAWAVTPANLGGLLQTAGAIRQWGTDQAVGDAMRQGGDVLKAFLADPRAQGNIAPAVSAISSAQQNRLATDTAWNQAIYNRLSPLLHKGDLTKRDIIDNFATTAAMLPNIPSEKLAQEMNALPGDDPKALRDHLVGRVNQALGPDATTSFQQGPPDPLTGAYRQIQRGAANYLPGMTVGLPHGSETIRNEALARSTGYRQAVQPLEKALELISVGGPRMGGLGAGELSQLANFANFITKGNLPEAATYADISAQLKKYYERNRDSQGASGATNAFLAASIAGNPNFESSPLASFHLARGDLANRRSQQVADRLAETTPVAELPYLMARFRNSFDARAMGYDMMNPAAKKKLLGQLDKRRAMVNGTQQPSEYDRFMQSYRMGHQAGVFGNLHLEPGKIPD